MRQNDERKLRTLAEIIERSSHEPDIPAEELAVSVALIVSDLENTIDPGQREMLIRLGSLIWRLSKSFSEEWADQTRQ